MSTFAARPNVRWGLIALLATALAQAVPAVAQAAEPTGRISTFTRGEGGWQGPQGLGGGTAVDASLGQPAPALRTRFNDYGISFVNVRAAEVVRQVSAGERIVVALQALTLDLRFGPRLTSRELILEFRDFDNPPRGLPYTSVWTVIGTLDPRAGAWQRMAVTIDDPLSPELPPGWGGYGAEDPDTFEPILPPGRNFADVLASADEVALTTLKPGFFYGFTDFDVALDNIAVVRRPAR